jgi:hypothetical protein
MAGERKAGSQSCCFLAAGSWQFGAKCEQMAVKLIVLIVRGALHETMHNAQLSRRSGQC